MKSRSTFFKLFFDNLLAMLAIIALAGLFTYQRLDANYQKETQQNQIRLTQMAVQYFQEMWPLTPDRIDQISKKIFQDTSTRLTVILADGTVLGDSQDNPLRMKNHKTEDRPEVLAALAGQSGHAERRSETTGIQSRYIAMPLTYNNQVVAVVRIAMPVKTIAQGESLLRNAVIWAAVAGTVAAVLLGLLTSWIWYTPLRRMTETARQIASGDLSTKAGIEQDSRMTDLALALNDMRDNLGKYLGQITSQHQDFQTVLAHLQEGVIATNAQGRIVLINQAAGDMFAVDPRHSTGQFLQNALACLEIINFREQVIASSSPIRGQLEMDTPSGRRNIEAHGVNVSPGLSNIGCLLVLHDVTELAATAAIKAQFVANASHELRTPLATIRAAVDSLASADPDDKQESAKLTAILDRHVRRLEEMTNDLLDLHMVESPRFPLRIQMVALENLAQWIHLQFDAQAQEKNLNFQVIISPAEQLFFSDRKLLEMILRNLIDNAFKFTPAHASVTCTLKMIDHDLILSVSDTGVGISSADQSRVFERFYQSDSSRSGHNKTRGTGLGLAIVKHAAERLRAKINLQSALGAGTTITLTVPDSFQLK